MNWWLKILDYFDCNKYNKYKKLYHVRMKENEELKLLIAELVKTQSEIIKLIKKK
tara:strand:+ start:817 stop:981 length:165 start_codon:yes stop_codon:yes gene_type:complete